ncbi:MAG TPA: L-seryl-tRNA(Sec) selenium transferase [Candidatus Dormibacteraeota bacterium]|nr:L-seryl-tRNA(Sec) selenium transferase [Candidatus Dormibacteraeota bacterium]
MPQASPSKEARGKGRPPAVGRLLMRPEISQLVTELGHQTVVQAVRRAVSESDDRDGHSMGNAEEVRLAERTRVLLEGSPRRLHRVINGTGIVIHTNLGRAPLGSEVATSAAQVAAGYSNLEMESAGGRRGDRQDLLFTLLCQLSGGEAAMVVNNGAAAVLLALATLCHGREVVVSRGEAIEIGGGFRIPEILRLSGARLVEVGTTNRTHVSDYVDACGSKTAAFLRVHQSNFSMAGFVARPNVTELAAAAHGRGVLLLEDVGSGLIPPAAPVVAAEDRLRSSLGAGVDLLFCSGDKLVGGSQAGLILGREDLVGRLRKHPLSRALRPDKLQLAVLEETLLRYAIPGRRDEIPVWRMIRLSPDELRARAGGWADALSADAISAEVVPLRGAVGGGTTPGPPLPSFGILLRSRHPGRLRRQLVQSSPPVVGLERADGVAIDARCVLPGEDEELLAVIRAASGKAS